MLVRIVYIDILICVYATYICCCSCVAHNTEYVQYIHMADKIMLVRMVYIDILICVYATYVAAHVLPIY